MSIYVMVPALKAHFPDVPATDDRAGCHGTTLKLVTLALADSANEDGTGARPGIRAIAEFAQCHTATAGRALAILAELGAITVVDPGGAHRRAIYDVDVSWLHAAVEIRHRQTLPLCAHDARKDRRASRAREVRASDAREVRASDARSYVSTSSTSPDEHEPPPVEPSAPHTRRDDNAPPRWWIEKFGYLAGDDRQ